VCTLLQGAKFAVRKLGAAIYLERFGPLPIAAFRSDFRDGWPRTKCEQGREEVGFSHFRIGMSQIAVEVRRTSVPRSVTNSVLHATLHWPTAKQDLSTRQAHIAVADSNDSRDKVHRAILPSAASRDDVAAERQNKLRTVRIVFDLRVCPQPSN